MLIPFNSIFPLLSSLYSCSPGGGGVGDGGMGGGEYGMEGREGEKLIVFENYNPFSRENFTVKANYIADPVQVDVHCACCCY